MSETLTNIVRSNNRTAPTAALHVEVVADFVCPFSYIGKRRLDRALESVGGPAEVAWYPFQLNPDMPADGISFESYLKTRFGGRSNIQPVLDQLTAEGREEGIDFNFMMPKRVPNTTAAHQLMHLAATRGADQTALAETLFSAFFEKGLDIGDQDVLIRLAWDAVDGPGPRDLSCAAGVVEAEATGLLPEVPCWDVETRWRLPFGLGVW